MSGLLINLSILMWMISANLVNLHQQDTIWWSPARRLDEVRLQPIEETGEILTMMSTEWVGAARLTSRGDVS